MPKFSCTNALGISSCVCSRTSGCMRWPPLWMTCDRGEVVLPDRRVVDQADQQRRHHLDVRDPVLLDQREHLLRSRGRAQHHLAAVEEEALDARAGERQVVRDRQREQQHRVAASRRRPARRSSSCRRSRCACAGSASGCRWCRPRAGRCRGRSDRSGFRGARWSGAPVRARSARAAHPGRRSISGTRSPPDPTHHRPELEVALPLGIDARRGVRELHELADLGVAMGDERGDRDRADLLQREVEQDELGDVRQRQAPRGRAASGRARAD